MMIAGLLLAAEVAAAPAAGAASCDAKSLIDSAKNAAGDKAKTRDWADQLTLFRKRCGDSSGWKKLEGDPDVGRLLLQVTVTSGKHGAGSGSSSGAGSSSRTVVGIEHEMTLLSLKLGAAEAACPDLKACTHPNDKPLLAETKKALRRYFARIGGGEGDVLEVSELLRRFGGRLKELPSSQLDFALSLAPILSMLESVHLTGDDIGKFPAEFRRILEEGDAPLRREKLIAYFEAHGQEATATLALLQPVVATERRRQEIGDRVRANQVTVLVDTSAVEDLREPCAVSERLRQGALPPLVRSGYADDSGVYTRAGDCAGGECAVTFRFVRDACQRDSVGAAPGQPPAPACVGLRLRFGAGEVQQKPIPVAGAGLLCAGGAAGREAVVAAINKALVDVVNHIALVEDPLELVPGALTTPQLLGEAQIDSSDWQAALWIDEGNGAEPSVFGKAVADSLTRYKTTGPAALIYRTAPPPKATRLHWDRSQGQLFFFLTASDGKTDFLRAHFSQQVVKETEEPALAVTTALTVLNYYARNAPNYVVVDLRKKSQAREAERPGRAYNVLLAGFPGLADGNPANDRESRALATADAIFMGAAALLAGGAMADRTLFHEGKEDSLAWSRGMFVGAQVSLIGAAVVKIWGLVRNP